MIFTKSLLDCTIHIKQLFEGEYMVDYVAMGKRIRKLREKKGWTQGELAYEIHKSNTTVSHIEVGSGRPELNTVVDIANALEVSVDTLLCESLKNAETEYKNELSEFLLRCSPGEIRLINELVPIFIEAYRREIRKEI